MPRGRSRADAARWPWSGSPGDAALRRAAGCSGCCRPCRQPSWPVAGAAAPADAPDRAAADQGDRLPAVLNLAAGQCEDNRLAVALAAQVDLGREAARERPSASSRRRDRGPPCAPRRHAGERARPCCPGSATSTRPAPRHRPGPATLPARVAIRPTGASGRTGSTPCPPGLVPRQIPPGRTAVEHPENAVEDPAVVIIRPPGPRLLRRQHGSKRAHCASVNS